MREVVPYLDSRTGQRRRPPLRAATFVWQGKVVEVDLDTREFQCPQCGMYSHLPHTLIADGQGFATISPSVVCEPSFGGCGWHVVINGGTAL